jgi:hypothetical protein
MNGIPKRFRTPARICGSAFNEYRSQRNTDESTDFAQSRNAVHFNTGSANLPETTYLLLDFYVFEPAVAAVILKTDVADSRQFADRDASELVARPVRTLAGLVPFIQVDR